MIFATHVTSELRNPAGRPLRLGLLTRGLLHTHLTFIHHSSQPHPFYHSYFRKNEHTESPFLFDEHFRYVGLEPQTGMRLTKVLFFQPSIRILSYSLCLFPSASISRLFPYDHSLILTFTTLPPANFPLTSTRFISTTALPIQPDKTKWTPLLKRVKPRPLPAG